MIEEILVRPNETVSKGQVLIRFDDTDLTHRKNTLQQELALAEERLRKAKQKTLNSTAERSEFAELASQIELKQHQMMETQVLLAGSEVNYGIRGPLAAPRATRRGE